MSIKAPSAFDAMDKAIHSMVQPLTALLFMTDIALMQNSPEACKKAMEDVQRECNRAVGILEDLRTAAAQAREEKTA